MMALAGNAFAYDALEAGTAESPKYYVIKANRGLPWVTYTAEAKDNGGAETHLYRANELSDAAVWAVVPGTADGTVNIYSYTTQDSEDKAYMLTYVTKDGAEFAGVSGAVATTGNEVDIYTKKYGDGSFGISIINVNGFVNVEGGSLFYGLDATGGSEFMGNWWCGNDGGNQWWFYAVDTDNLDASLAAAQKAVYKDEMKPMVTEYTGYFQDYINAVPYVATELQEGIDALNNLEGSADYSTQITSIWTQYTNKANVALSTMFGGKEVVLNNIRKFNGGNASYLGLAESSYVGMQSYVDNKNAVFTLESTTYNETTPSYYLYNAATNTYFGPDRTPVATKDEACSVHFVLQTGRDSNGANPVVGFNILANGVSGNNAFNLNNANPPALSYWRASGSDSDGSIWGIVEYTDDSVLEEEKRIVEEAKNSVIDALSPYIPNVPEAVAEILQAAVLEADKLEYNADLAANANALRTNAIADANNYLKNDLGGKNWALRSLRNGYVVVGAETDIVDAVSNQESENSVFEFIKVADGGYKIYNHAVKEFFGPIVTRVNQAGNNETFVTLVADYSEAIEVYPVLNHNGANYGLGFALTNGGNECLNTNARGLHQWYLSDDGSVFVITDKGDVTTEIVEVEKAEAVKGVYDLSGRKLSAPVRGINIINGKKVLVK